MFVRVWLSLSIHPLVQASFHVGLIDSRITALSVSFHLDVHSFIRCHTISIRIRAVFTGAKNLNEATCHVSSENSFRAKLIDFITSCINYISKLLSLPYLT
ncbi:uncharacterized protein EDB93DRAFT_325476 [Suillus bovinus]|uniref:uncharacterized protein n=1 Tax=Suillus bovinus TaxID=48563 RepID=UPI001B87D3DD|nr:uncharacterized protein EDB93DRAFT_325476 [Suillus bovinus]KAG2126008.1 hypothetical protein EDB93DRAFT_325476 [Suillus bovinus]